MRFLLFCQGIAGYIEGTHIEVAALQIGEGVLLGVSLQEVLAVSKIHLAQQLMLLEVYGISLAAVAYHHDALACKREESIVEGSYLDVFGRSNPLVDVIDAEESGLLACRLVDEIAGIHILANEFIAPPGAPAVLSYHVTIVVAAEVQVFQCKGFLAFLSRNHALSL